MDYKRFIDRDSPFSLYWDTETKAGSVPSFRAVFHASRVALLSDEEKTGRDIIQFSFFLRTSDGGILLMDRSDASHRLTRGASVLVSWSPVVEHFRDGHDYPVSYEDVLDIFHHEVSIEAPLFPKIQYIGLARNDLPGQKRYYFYIFEAACSLTSHELMTLIHDWGKEKFFEKDREDVIGVFPLADLVEQHMLANPVDVGVLQCIYDSEDNRQIRETGNSCLFLPYRGTAGDPGIPDFLFK